MVPFTFFWRYLFFFDREIRAQPRASHMNHGLSSWGSLLHGATYFGRQLNWATRGSLRGGGLLQTQNSKLLSVAQSKSTIPGPKR